MKDIYSFVKEQENDYETSEVRVGDNFFWNMRKHIQMIFHLKNGYFTTGANNFLRAFKNIMEPILHLAYWTEDIEVKDVTFFTEEDNNQILSFLVKKYHDEVYTKKVDLDTLFDEITESDLDYGGVLIQKGMDKPEILVMNSIAFCDQTDLMGSPMGFKFYFSPSKLRGMSKAGWGDPKNGATITLDELCTLASTTKDSQGTQDKQKNKTPGKQIEVYIIRGEMPYDYLYDDGNMDDYCGQIQIIAYYFDKDNNRTGVTLYRKEDDGEDVKFFTSQKVFQRALGRGEGEMLIHPQVWTNFLTIHKMNMLEAGSKVPLYTDDPSYVTKNKIQDMENLEITTIEDGKRIFQVPTAAPANLQMLEVAIRDWYDQGQLAGSAFDPIMGKQPPSGTTFRGQERNVSQGQGLHDRRMGKRARFIAELYRDWILPDIKKAILKGPKFLASLTSQELLWVSEQIAINTVNEHVKNIVLENGGYINNKPITNDDIQQLTQGIQQGVLKRGNKQLIEILKEDFQDVEIKVSIDVANKQKDMGLMHDRLMAIIQEIMANPIMLKSQPITTLFNRAIESLGLPPIDFSTLDIPMPMPMRRVTESIDYKDLQPEAQQAMLQNAGIQVPQGAPTSAQPVPSPMQPNQPVK